MRHTVHCRLQEPNEQPLRRHGPSDLDLLHNLSEVAHNQNILSEKRA